MAIRGAWIFRSCSRAFVVMIATKLEPAMFEQRETIDCRDKLTFVERGSAARQGRIFLKGQCFGECMILVNPHLRQFGYRATSLTYTEVLTLSRSALYELVESAALKEDSLKIRKSVPWLALRQWMLWKLEALASRADPARIWKTLWSEATANSGQHPDRDDHRRFFKTQETPSPFVLSHLLSANVSRNDAAPSDCCSVLESSLAQVRSTQRRLDAHMTRIEGLLAKSENTFKHPVYEQL